MGGCYAMRSMHDGGTITGMTVIATLIVERTGQAFIDRARAYQILVDGTVRGGVRCGRELTLALPPGRHLVRARLDLTGSETVPVHLGPGETRKSILVPVTGDRRPEGDESFAVKLGGAKNAKVSRGQCIRYAEPIRCFGWDRGAPARPTSEGRRRPLRFCMDRYEWPNRRGEKPRVLTSWEEARGLCASTGKRLCTEAEFNFACEGEEMRPYVYGHARDATQCNFDRPYRPRTFVFSPWDTCQQDDACRAAFDALDQRLPAGSMASCRSDHGVYDLIGNVNEWVVRPDERSPRRSGIKGGWWGPVRARCRPTVTFHDEGDYGYEVGFRCCADAA